MIKDEAVEQDLHFTAGNVEVKIEDTAAAVVAADGGAANPTGFDPMEEDHQAVVMATIGEKDLWLDRDQEHLLDVNDASIFYNDFPPLPDFPCMSSSSSSSSTPAASKPMAPTSSSSSAASSSPAASWAVMKSDAEEDTGRMSFQQTTDVEEVKVEPAALSSTASMEIPPSEHDGLGDVDCIDVVENFGYMDLIDANEIWDPSSVFQSENPQEFLEDQQTAAPLLLEGSSPQDPKMQCQDENDGFSFLQGNSELAMIFFEWLKQNKDYISAEDMRSIKLKRSTIESASKRLGSTKEGKKQLLKLILEWVEQYQLQKKRMRESGPQSPYAYQETVQNSDPNPNPNPNPNFTYSPLPPDPNACFSTSPWMPPAPPPPHASEVTAMVAAPPPFAGPPMATGYGGDPYSNPIPVAPMNHHHHHHHHHHQVVNGIPYPHAAEYPVMEHAQSWVISPFPMQQPHQFSHFPDNGNMITHQQALYGHPYQLFDPNGERLMRLGSSATKEARKKRMARQRRLYSHHHRHSSNSNQHQNQMNDAHVVGEAGEDGDQAGSPGNWVYWSPSGGGSSPTPGNGPPADASQPPHSGDRAPVQQQNYQRQSSSDRRQQQGWKTEKNLKFLLQKVLKQSDVGNLGRIVLPKKEAESHLPELESRDGISIAMEDIGTSRVWNMRYRFWPNNKSRMYLLENTGDFVRVNGLQEGDFIVIYSDTKCGKYMIRGVKVRQPGGKLEGKKPARRNMRNLSLAGNSSSLAPIKQAVR